MESSISPCFLRQQCRPFPAAPSFFQFEPGSFHPLFYVGLLIPEDPGKNEEAALAGSLHQLRKGLAKKDAIKISSNDVVDRLWLKFQNVLAPNPELSRQTIQPSVPFCCTYGDGIGVDSVDAAGAELS